MCGPASLPIIKALAGRMASLLDPSMSWDDVDDLRKHLDGPLILKGMLIRTRRSSRSITASTASIVSNHGGRQLDGAPATLDALPGVVEAVGGTHSGARRRRHPARRRRGQGPGAGR